MFSDDQFCSKKKFSWEKVEKAGRSLNKKLNSEMNVETGFNW